MKKIPGREERSHKGGNLGKIETCIGCQRGHCVWSRMREGGSGAMRSETGLELGSEGLAGRGKEFGSHSTWEWKPREGFEQEKKT